MLFDELRDDGHPTSYSDSRTAAKSDVVFFGLVYAFAAVFVSFLVVLPSFRPRPAISSFSFVAASLFIGASILVTNYGYAWQSGEITTRTRYKAFSSSDINATVGIHIGLRGINVTLKGEPTQQLNESIDYNEHFSWEWQQGVVGFGSQAAPMSKDYLAAKWRGAPLPVLWVAEYFIYDDGQLQFCRHYRQAGYYSHIFLWTALPLWLLANVFTQIHMIAACTLASLTALFVFAATVTFATLKSPRPLEVPFEDAQLVVSYGWCFWLCVATGCLCAAFAALLGLNLLQTVNTSEWYSWLSMANKRTYNSGGTGPSSSSSPPGRPSTRPETHLGEPSASSQSDRTDPPAGSEQSRSF